MRIVLLIAALAVCLVTQLSAGPIGSFQVDYGPSWFDVPPAYTGQEAAALVFGGLPTDYFLSTSDVTITHTNWVSTWGGACGGVSPCGTEVAEDFKVSTGGFYQTVGDTSAYVDDWATGAQYTNYVWNSGSGSGSVPEPGTWLLMACGLPLLAARRLRRS